MFRKFNKFLMVAVLIFSLMVALGNQANALRPMIVGCVYKINPICIDCILKSLGNVTKIETTLGIGITSVSVLVDCNNNGDQSPNASFDSPAHFPTENLEITEPVNPEDVLKNGTANETRCFDDAFFDAEIGAKLAALDEQGLLCNNPNWYWVVENGYIFTGFSMWILLEQEDGSMHYLELDVTPSDEECWDYVITYEEFIR